LGSARHLGRRQGGRQRRKFSEHIILIIIIAVAVVVVVVVQHVAVARDAKALQPLPQERLVLHFCGDGHIVAIVNVVVTIVDADPVPGIVESLRIFVVGCC
jgi:low affinity Fe/Cu permease